MPNLAFGTTFSWGGVAVTKLTAINGIELSVDTVEVTTHSSADAYKEYIAGLIDAGEISLEGNYEYTDTTGQQAMLTDLNARTAKTGVITFPAATGTTWTFTGIITALKIGDAPVDGVIPFSATIKPTGKPVFAVAASAGMSAVTLSNSAVLYPAFAIGTFDYVATVLTGVSSITVTPTAAAGVITVNGSVVATTVASSAIPLGAAGSVTPIVVVVAESNKAPKTYTFKIARA